MNALVLHGPGDARVEIVNKPSATAGSVVVRVVASPIWDYVSQVIDGSLGFPHTYPQIFGTCCIGRVEEVGPDATLLKRGQLVFCDHIVYSRDAPEHRIVLGYHGGHSPQERTLSSNHWRHGCCARFPVENIHLIDEHRIEGQGIAFDQLCEISTIMSAVGAANSIDVHAGDTVIVTPATGFFSSGAVVAALGLGANVVAAGRNKDSLEAMIQAFGPDATRISPVVLTGHIAHDTEALRAATPGGRGADGYMDFSSPEMAQGTHFQACLLALKRGGRCCFAGMVPQNVPLPYHTIRVNSLTIRGAFAQSRKDVESTIRLIENGHIKLYKTITGHFGLQDYSNGLALAKETRGWEGMVIIKP